MSDTDHRITGEEWTRCEEALAALTGGVSILTSMSVWDPAAFHSTAGGLHFLAQSMNREIDTLKELLGFAESKPRFEVGDEAEGDANV